MTCQSSLASLLDAYMRRAMVGDARLAKQVNSLADNPYFIHRSTLRNWRTGSAQKVNSWRQLVTVAIALRLDETEASALLESGGCPSIPALMATANDVDKALLALWSSAPDNTAVTIPTVGRAADQTRQMRAADDGDLRVKGDTPSKTGVWTVIVAGTVVASLAAIAFKTLSFGRIQSRAQEYENVLVNSQFDDGTLGWIAYANDEAFADFEVVGESMHIRIDERARKGWHITIGQKDLEVVAGKIYTARFRVRGDPSNSMRVDITRMLDPKTSLSFGNSGGQSVSVSDIWTEKAIEFEAIESVSLRDGGARLFFMFGKSEKGRIMLDDIEFYEGRKASPVTAPTSGDQGAFP